MSIGSLHQCSNGIIESIRPIRARPMTLQQLRYLLAIADSGLNITSAAERLYTSQPGISKQLKLLEQELKVQLCSRARARVFRRLRRPGTK